MSLPSNRISPVGCDAELGKSRRIDIAETVLPEPDSPTRATVSPIADRERHAFDDARGVGALAEGDGKIADIDERLAGRHQLFICLNVLRGSSASRTASPMKIASDSMMEMEMKPEMPSHGASRCFFPFEQKFTERRRTRRHAEPQKIERGQGRDAAGKLERHERQRRDHRIRQQMLEYDLPVGEAQGARCPDVFEVTATQKFGAHEADERRPAKISRMPSSVQKPGTKSDDRISSTKSSGIEFQISSRRWKIRSVLPPK